MALNAMREKLETAVERGSRRSSGPSSMQADRGEGRRDDDRHADPAWIPPASSPAQIRREDGGSLPGLGVSGSSTAARFDDGIQLRRAQLPARPSDAVAATDPLPRRARPVLRTETSPSQIRTMEAQDPPVYIVSLGTRLSPRHARRDAHADVPSGRRVGRGRGNHARRSRGDARLPLEGAVRREPAQPVRDAPLPVHRAVGGGARLVPHLRRLRVRGLPALGMDRGRRVGDGRPEPVGSSAIDPERYTGFAFGWGLERIAVLRNGMPISASSVATTPNCSDSSDEGAALLAP